MRKRKASALSPGDTIRVIAPASPFQKSQFIRAVRWLEARGYRVRYEKGIFQKKDYLAGGDPRRIREFVSAFQDKDAKAVFVARGGYGTLRLYEAMRQSVKLRTGKIFMGLSDLTIPLNQVARETGWVTVHGPMMAGESFLGLSTSRRSALFRLLEKETPQVLRAGTDYRVLKSGQVKGRLWGGNFTMVQCTLGTKLQIPFRRSILFLEEVNDPRYKIDRLFAHFSLAGVFQEISGLILGDFLDQHGKPHTKSFVREMVQRYVGKQNIPVLSGLRAGHKQNHVWLPIGGEAAITRGGKQLTLEPLVGKR